MKICIILGCRPEIIKLYGIIKECKERGLDYYVVHTGQHYDDNMSKSFFTELGLPRENYNLQCNNSTRRDRSIDIQKKLMTIREFQKPDIVICQGDTDSSMIGATTAKMMGIKVAHVEGSIRSNSAIPEEYNRRIIDQLSDYILAPTLNDLERGIKEGFLGEIKLFGNTVVDCLNSIERSIKQKDQVFFTLHRDSNVDNKDVLQNILKQIQLLSENIVFACHPRTKKKISEFGLSIEGIIIIDPLPYKKTIQHISQSKYIITDSGGIQEECACLGKKCIIIRDSTERGYVGSILWGGNMFLSRKKLLSISDSEMTNPFNPNNSKNISRDILSYLISKITCNQI